MGGEQLLTTQHEQALNMTYDILTLLMREEGQALVSPAVLPYWQHSTPFLKLVAYPDCFAPTATSKFSAWSTLHGLVVAPVVVLCFQMILQMGTHALLTRLSNIYGKKSPPRTSEVRGGGTGGGRGGVRGGGTGGVQGGYGGGVRGIWRFTHKAVHTKHGAYTRRCTQKAACGHRRSLVI